MARRQTILTLTVDSLDGLARLGRVARGFPPPVAPRVAAGPQRPLIPLAQRAEWVGVSFQPSQSATSRRRLSLRSTAPTSGAWRFT